MADGSKGFKTPRDVTDYFDQKALRPAFSWLDVWGEEHAKAFTVAKATETELLGTFQRSISTALKEGQTFETWKEEVEKELRRLKWWGPREVTDPLGRDTSKIVDFSSPRRLRTIFNSNMRAARAAGQWQRIQRSKRALPFILYVQSVSLNPRSEHLGWVGTILPVDDPFWRTHFPPNGWECKCAVRSVTAREAKSLGYDPDVPGPQIVWRKFVNRRTGEVMQLPEGIDRGWQTNSGLSRAKGLTNMLAEDLRKAGPEIAARQVSDFWNSPERMVLAGLKEKGISLPAATSVPLAKELGTNGSLVTVFADTAQVKLGKPKELAERKNAFDRLNSILTHGVIVDEGREDARSLLWFDGAAWWAAVVQKTKTGYLRVITFHRSSTRKAEKQLRNIKEE